MQPIDSQSKRSSSNGSSSRTPMELLGKDELSVRESNLLGQVTAIITEEFRYRGVSIVPPPQTVPRIVFDEFAPRIDLVGFRECELSRGVASAFNGLVLPAEHTLHTTLRIARDTERLPARVGLIGAAYRSELVDSEKGMRWFTQANLDDFDPRRLATEEKLQQDVRLIIELSDIVNSVLQKIDLSDDEHERLSNPIFRITNRQILMSTLAAFGINSRDHIRFIILALDGTESGKWREFQQELPQRISEAKTKFLYEGSIELPSPLVEFIYQLRQVKGTCAEIGPHLEKLSKVLPSSDSAGRRFRKRFDTGAGDLLTVLSRLESISGLCDLRVEGDLKLARPCGIYTGTEFELYWPEAPEMGSGGGGGRFDTISETMTGIPLNGVGGALGVSRICRVLSKLTSLAPMSNADVLVVLQQDLTRVDGDKFSFLNQRLREVTALFRGKKIRAIDSFIPSNPLDPNCSEAIRYATAQGIPYVFCIDPSRAIQTRCYEVNSGEWNDCTPDGFKLPAE